MLSFNKKILHVGTVFLKKNNKEQKRSRFSNSRVKKLTSAGYIACLQSCCEL